MKTLLDKANSLQRELYDIAKQLDDKEYWIEEAKKYGFIPGEKPWIHVEVAEWRTAISVYGENSRYYFHYRHITKNNGWHDTPFPKEHQKPLTPIN